MTVVSFNTEATIHIPADDDGVKYENTFNCILTQNMDKSEEYTIDKKQKVDWFLTSVCRWNSFSFINDFNLAS
jgi:hypothetical protein